jgi:hypothetical protein
LVQSIVNMDLMALMDHPYFAYRWVLEPQRECANCGKLWLTGRHALLVSPKDFWSR